MKEKTYESQKNIEAHEESSAKRKSPTRARRKKKVLRQNLRQLKLNQIEPATFAILLFWTFFRGSFFRILLPH